MEEIKSMLTAILENQQVTNAKLEALTMDVRRLEGRVVNIEERVTKIEERVTKIEERITKIEERVTKIEETMATNEDVFEVKAYLKHLAQKTGEHDMEIKVLKDKQLQVIGSDSE